MNERVKRVQVRVEALCRKAMQVEHKIGIPGLSGCRIVIPNAGGGKMTDSVAHFFHQAKVLLCRFLFQFVQYSLQRFLHCFRRLMNPANNNVLPRKHVYLAVGGDDAKLDTVKLLFLHQAGFYSGQIVGVKNGLGAEKIGGK